MGRMRVETITPLREFSYTVPGHKQLLSAPEMAFRLNLPESWVYRAARRGTIPCLRIGKYRRFDYEEVLEAIKKLETEG